MTTDAPGHQEPLLITWLNFNHSMNYINYKAWDGITYQFRNRWRLGMDK